MMETLPAQWDTVDDSSYCDSCGSPTLYGVCTMCATQIATTLKGNQSQEELDAAHIAHLT